MAPSSAGMGSVVASCGTGNEARAPALWSEAKTNSESSIPAVYCHLEIWSQCTARHSGHCHGVSRLCLKFPEVTVLTSIENSDPTSQITSRSIVLSSSPFNWRS